MTTATITAAIRQSTIQPAMEPMFISRTEDPLGSTPSEPSTRRNTGMTRQSSTAMITTIMTPSTSG